MCKQRLGRTVLDRLHQQGAFKVLFPRTSGKTLNGILLNTAGGLTGNDKMQLEATAAEDCRLALTTQAAERIYRALPGEVTHITNTLTASSDSHIHWLPQETILFDGAALRRTLRIDMRGGSRLLAVEPLVFGRTEMGEQPNLINFRDHVEIRRDGHLIFSDRTVMQGDGTRLLCGPASGNGQRAMASLVLAAHDAEQMLPGARAMMAETGGVSLVRDGLLFGRIMARDGFALRRILLPLIKYLSAAPLPRTWMT